MRLIQSPREHFLRFLRFLRILTWRLLDLGGWPEQAKENHLQSKSSSKLPSLCSTQPHINGLFAQVLTTMGLETCVPGDLVSHPQSLRTECTSSRTTRKLGKRRNKSNKEPV